MKNKPISAFICFISIFIIFFPLFLFGQMKSYNYFRKLDKIGKEDYYEIKIAPPVMAKSQSFLSDIRIFDAAGKDTVEIPFVAEWLGSTSEEFEIPSTIINESYRDRCCSFVTFRFGEKTSINSIRLKLEEDNFDKSVTLLGSNDNKQWFTIREHLRIVGFTNNEMKVKYTSLNFPLSEYAYFRIELDDKNSDRIKIIGFSTLDIDTKDGNYSELRVVSRKDSINKQNKTSEIILGMEQNFFISHIVMLPVRGKDFFRNVNIYYSAGTVSSPKGNFENWTMDCTGVLRSDDKNKFSLINAQSSKIKIEILNRDDQPLEIPVIKVYSEDYRIVAKLPASDHLYLCYGKKHDQPPLYDLVHFEDKIPEKLPLISYGDEIAKLAETVETNPLFEKKIWLWVILGTVIVIIGLFSLRMLVTTGKNQ